MFQIFPIYNELKDRSQVKMNAVILTSIGSAAACYEIVRSLLSRHARDLRLISYSSEWCVSTWKVAALRCQLTDVQIGYLTFGDHVGSNIIAMYPATSLFVALGRLGIVLLVGLSYPLQLLPCRACVYAFTSGIVKGKKAVPAIAYEYGDDSSDEDDADPTLRESDEEDDPLMPKRYVNDRGIGTGDMRKSKYLGFTTGILVSGFLIALAVDELEIGAYLLWPPARKDPCSSSHILSPCLNPNQP